MDDRPKATISDVARRAGVDRAVVSKVLSDDPNLRVREATRERVHLAATELNYRPNYHAQRLARARAGAVGLLIPAGNPLTVPVMSGAADVAAERGLLLWTATHEGTLTDHHMRLLHSGAVDAALVAGLSADVDAASLFADRQVPAILVNRRSKGARRWVILDDERAANMATCHLIERGHRQIGFAGGPRGVDTSERRRRGYMTAMRKAGLEVDASWSVSSDYTPEGGAAAVEAFLDAARPPTAIVAADANEGLGVWHTLVARGVSVPADVSLIAIHRLPAEAYRVPSMSCIEMPLRRLGQRAMELVLDAPWDAPIHEVIGDELTIVHGDTVASRSSD